MLFEYYGTNAEHKIKIRAAKACGRMPLKNLIMKIQAAKCRGKENILQSKFYCDQQHSCTGLDCPVLISQQSFLKS